MRCSRRRIWSTAADAWATTWNLSKVTRALGKCSATPLMKAGDISMLTNRTCWGAPLCRASYSAKRVMVLASLPSVTNTTLRSLVSAAMVR